jgi:mono/diheme cytochrome c family protein
MTLVLLAMTAATSHADDPAGLEFFEQRVRPILVTHCQQCHGAEKQENNLRVDSLAALVKGGDFGPAVVPGQPEKSLLVGAINHGEIVQMPPKTKLKAAQIDDLTAWVKRGAPWPDAKVEPLPTPSAEKKPLFTDEQKSFWAFQPPVKHATPMVQQLAWVQSPLDAFILSGLEAKGLSPAPPADKRTLIRRATFDLLGLPPTPDEVEAFLADESPEAFARVVDRLLASPHYGQRWGRHWLDVARYADSNGMDENVAHANAWRYRDYVIDSLNHDKPYDQFVREQIAGDLLPDPDPAITAERFTATGFLVIGPKMLAEDDPQKMEMDIVDEQLDTVGRTFLGLTLGCARCHDHKFDPIPTADYYSLAAIFKSTQTMANFKVVAMWHERSIASPEQTKEHQALQEVAKAQRAKYNERSKQASDEFLAAERLKAEQYLAAAQELQRDKTLDPAKLAGERNLNVAILRQWVEYVAKQPTPPTAEMLTQLAADPKGPFALPKDAEQYYPAAAQDELKQLRDVAAAAEKAVPALPMAMGASEGQINNLKIHLRGNYLTQDREVPRQFLQVIAGQQQPPIDSSRSGRLELAQWMTSSQQPLTARVMVNRVWHWHFGQGLVRSVDNFGRLGETPDNLPLLDYLAVQFMEQGWFLKDLHRTIMLSSTYQMSTSHNASAAAVDPENRLHWRHERRRLEAEALRDGVLAISGELDAAQGGSLLGVANHAYVASTASERYDPYHVARRSVYLPVARSNVYDLFQAFDFADPSSPNGQRDNTTVAPQALALMNSRLIEEQTERWATRLIDIAGDDRQRVQAIYLQAYSRPPSEQELARSLEFVRRIEKTLVEQKRPDAQMSAWQSLCRVVLASSEFVYVE